MGHHVRVLDEPPETDDIRHLQAWLDNVMTGTLLVPDLPGHLDRLLKRLLRRDKQLFKADEGFYLKTLSQVAELYTICGRINDARRALHRGNEVIASVPQMLDPQIDQGGRELVRERLRYAINFTIVANYASAQFHETARLLNQFRELVEGSQGLATQDFPCHGTLRAIYFHLANVHLRLRDFAAVDEYFTKVLQANAEKLILQRRRAPGRAPKEKASALHYVAHALLGLAHLEYERGALGRVHWFIHPARALVSQSEDRLTRAYVDRLYGAVLRSGVGDLDPEERRGSDAVKLKTAIEALTNALNTFVEFGHERGVIFTTFDLAAALASNGDFEAAEKLLQPLENSAERPVMCYAASRLSRIARARGDRISAMAFASRALEGVERDENAQRDLVSIRIDALLARAEANLMDPCDGTSVRRDLDLAQALSEQGKHQTRVEAICLLHYAASWAREKEVILANQYFHKAKVLLPGIEHANIKRLARGVERSIEACTLRGDLTIRAVSTGNLNYQDHEMTLRQYLLAVAKQEHSSHRKLADALGVSPTTIATWERELRQKR